ncbi:PAS domain S-box protein [Aliifodinibius salicampi]|uniref:histidine kinase n=1 Tax=Fodinibius salicampi TaxID=1920655 RepID=A0ABT3Q228_9BACT|nr:PAS domain S-box protein [Fodinibius salicampi]MCW9714157.1 PAS domain S-box protein [Fodinibius salicampi]
MGDNMELPSLFFDKHPNSMFVYDIDTLEMLEVNQSAVQKYGFSRDEFLQLTIEDIRPPEDIPTLRERLNQIQRTSDVSNGGTFRHQTKNGELLYVQVTGQDLSVGGRDARIAHIHDLTETLRLKNEIEETYRAQQELIHNNPLAMVKLDEDFRIIEWSRRAKQKSGYTEDEVLGKSLFDIPLFEEGEAASVKSRMQDIAAREKDRDRFEAPIQLNDGRRMHVLLHVSALRKPDGTLKSVLTFIENITAQKEAQKQLERSEQLFKSLFFNSPVSIVMIDANGKIQKVNKSYEELFGYQEKEVVGKDLLEQQLPEERHDEIEKLYAGIFKEGTSKYYEDQRLTKQGTTKDLLVGALPVMTNGEPIAAFGIYTDITKLRETEENLQQSLEEKEILLSEIHHRVKNNLAIISSLLQLEAMNYEEDSTVWDALIQSKSRIHSMAHIHEQLYDSRDFANISMEEYISDLVEYVCESMQRKNRRVDLSVVCDEISLNVNQAVPCGLMINELVTHAIKQAPGTQPLHIEVNFTRESERVTLVVEDDGAGSLRDLKTWSEESLEYQIVEQLVRQLEGDIDVAYTEEGKTRYEIKFPKTDRSGSTGNHFV